MPRTYRSLPLRYQVSKDIVDFLSRSSYQPGDKLPTEQELADLLEVSRFSLREGLHLLEQQRVIATRHGIGRFLLAHPSDIRIDITSLQSIPELLANFDIQPTDRLLEIRPCQASGEIAELLELEPGTPVLSIERIRYGGKVPIIYSIDTFAQAHLPRDWSPADFKGSLFTFLEKRCGKTLDYAQATIHAALLPEPVQKLLPEPHSLWVLLRQTIYDRQGHPVIYSEDYHSTQHVTFSVRRFRS
jgi:GntR family transcriptional regulator